MADKYINIGGHKLTTNVDSTWKSSPVYTFTMTNNGWQTGQTLNLGFTLEPGTYAMRLSVALAFQAQEGELIFNFGYGLLFVAKGLIWTEYVVNSVDKINSPISTIGVTPYSSGIGGTQTVTARVYFMRLK
jgi:hypothetical protein